MSNFSIVIDLVSVFADESNDPEELSGGREYEKELRESESEPDVWR